MFRKTSSILLSGVLFVFMVSCEEKAPVIDCNAINLRITTTTQSTPCSQDEGSISVNVSGGSGTYQYSLDGQTFQDESTFDNLFAGGYTVFVQDDNGCMAEEEEIYVDDVTDIDFTSESTEAGCGGSEGTLTVFATGGSDVYSFQLDGGSFQNDNVFEEVSKGFHTVLIVDSDGCSYEREAYVKSGISLEDEIIPIVDTYCAVSGCHVAGEPQPDFKVKSNILSHAEDIKERTQSGNMPRGTTMPDEFIEAFACWVDDGALDN